MNDTQRVSAEMYIDMVNGGAANLYRNKNEVNDLNVFPVPDGDTGDNMFMTISSASKTESSKSSTIGEVSNEVAHRMLLGARGNSGVILSRIFAGIARGLTGCTDADIPTLAYALECGMDEAYKSVSVPVEGTILTVCRESVSYANSQIEKTKTVEQYFENLISEAENSLSRTPEMLDVLAQAGVVDSGGAGFLFIAKGMKNALCDGEVEKLGEIAVNSNTSIDFSAFDENSECSYGYCTELLLRLQTKKVDIDSFDEKVIEDYLCENGESVVLVRDGSIVKIHVHTKEPGVILGECQKYGEFLTVKIENMQLQHNGKAESGVNLRVENARRKYASVVCCAGKGMADIFTELGADCIVNGGQSMNPSTEDFMAAFDKVNADTVFVFPNNKNIIMAANQAASLYDKSDIRVVSTKTVGQGYASFSMLDTTSGDADAIVDELNEIASGVVTGSICRSTRSTYMDGVDVVRGDYIGIADGKILSDSAGCIEAAKELCEKVNAAKYDIVIMLCGEDAKSDEAEELYNDLQKKYPRTEIIMLPSEQPVYDYIFVFE